MIGLIGKKIGMTRAFDENGQKVVVTVVEAGPCYVTDIKTQNNHGYDAVQLGFEQGRDKLATMPLKGHFKRAGVKPLKILREIRPFHSDSELKLGDEVNVDIFKVGDIVSVSGISKGKGFAGTVKRYGFGGGPKSHGQSDRLRSPGSIGQSSTPSRVIKGIKMPGRMGNKKVSVKNLKIVKVDKENNYLLIKGAIPGHRKSYVVVEKK